MKWRMGFAAIAALVLAGPVRAGGVTVIQEDASSVARDDLIDAKCAMADQDARSRLRVTIAGRCVSSCAFCRPRNPYFCTTPSTELWFHSSPSGVHYNPLLMAVLPPKIQSWVASRGGLRPTFWGMADPNWLVLKGPELFQLVPLCAEWASNSRTGPQTPVSVPALSESRRRRNAASEALMAQERMRAVAPVLPPSGSWPRR